MQATTTIKPAPTTQPCVCCRARAHDRIPDPDLQGYVCRGCRLWLERARIVLARAGIAGCVPEPEPKP